MSIHFLYPFLNQIRFYPFFAIELYDFFMYFENTSLSDEVKVLVAQSYLTLCDPHDCDPTVTCQDPLSMRFSRQGYWSGLPFPSPGDRPDPGIEPRSPAQQADSLPTELIVLFDLRKVSRI